MSETKFGPDFFEDPDIFKTYLSSRHRPDGPNETLEKPTFLQLLGEVKGRQILDLGCGDGMFALELFEAGCNNYLGIDASEKMVQVAKTVLKDQPSNIVHSKIESWGYPANQFDLVISRLALHYIENIGEVFLNVHKALVKNGRFVFSIVHPIITASDKSRQPGSRREDWIVDNYFSTGRRKVVLGDNYVYQYHRTIEDLYIGLQQVGFSIEALRESKPVRENFKDKDLFIRRSRIPLFLFLSAVK
jgi:SAM-dependent methyltransferase